MITSLSRIWIIFWNGWWKIARHCRHLPKRRYSAKIIKVSIIVWTFLLNQWKIWQYIKWYHTPMIWIISILRDSIFVIPDRIVKHLRTRNKNICYKFRKNILWCAMFLMTAEQKTVSGSLDSRLKDTIQRLARMGS